MADVRAVLVHQCRHRVAEQVTRAALAQPGRCDALFHDEGQMIAAERFALRCEEHRVVVGFCGKLGPRLGDVLLEPQHGALAHRDIAVLAALALVDQDQPAVELKIEQFQPHDFETAHSCRVQNLQERTVAQPDRIVHVRLRDDLLDLLSRKDDLGQTSGRGAATRSPTPDYAGCDSASSATGTTSAAQPGARAANGSSAAPRCVCVIEEIPLIAFEHGPRHLDRIGQPTLLQPLEEKLDVPVADLHGELGVVPHSKRAQVRPQQPLQRRRRRGLRFPLLPRGPSRPPVLTRAVHAVIHAMRYGYDRRIPASPVYVFRLFPVKSPLTPGYWRFLTRTTRATPATWARPEGDNSPFDRDLLAS